MGDIERGDQRQEEEMLFIPELGGGKSVVVLRRGKFIGTLKQNSIKNKIVFAWELKEQDLETPIDELERIVESGKELRTHIEASRPPARKKPAR